MSSTSFLDFLYVWARPHYCILLLCVFAVLSVVTTYGIAVGLNHVPAFLPYIIDAASNPPESCIFAQFMNFVAMFLCIVIYIRYRQVVEESQLWSKDTTTGPEESTPIKSQELSSTTAKLRELPLMCKPLKISTTTAPLQESKLLRNLNAFALILGFLGSFGLSLVANFQRTNVPLVHLSGTFMLFVFGFAYSWIQVYLTYKSVKRGIEMIVYDKMGMLLNNCKLLFRLTLSILMTIYFICGIVTLTTSNLKWTNQYGASSKKSRLLWTTEDPGYTDHIITTLAVSSQGMQDHLEQNLLTGWLVVGIVNLMSNFIKPSRLEPWNEVRISCHEWPEHTKEKPCACRIDEYECQSSFGARCPDDYSDATVVCS